MAPGVLVHRIEYVYDVFDQRIAKRVFDGADNRVKAERFVCDHSGGGLDPVVFVFDDAGSLTHR